MTLSERISEDIKAAQKNGETERLGVLRLVSAAIHNRVIEKGIQGSELPDEEVLAVLQKEAKKRREAIALFRQGKRDDLADKEEKELALLQTYLPPALTRADIEKVVAALRAEGLSDVNALMKAAMARLKGQADGRLVREVIEEKLRS